MPSTATSTPPASGWERQDRRPRLKLFGPVVEESAQRPLGQARPVHEGGVGGRVAEHGVALLDQGRDKAQVGRVTGGEDERLLHSHPVGQQLLQLGVEGQGAVEQAAAGDPVP